MGTKPLIQTAILKPKMARQGKLAIDVVAKLPSSSHHISRLTYKSSGLYDVPLTRRTGMDVHTSFHPNGEIHEKLTRGKLLLYPGGQVLGEAKPHTRVKEVILWQGKGQSWDYLKGVEKITQHQGFVNVKAMAAGYPIYGGTGADYVFDIDAQSLPSDWVDVEYFLVEPGNRQALEAIMSEMMESGRRPHESVTVEKVVMFTNLSPWLAIVSFSKTAEGSESFLDGHTP